jgi:hypothetical protein
MFRELAILEIWDLKRTEFGHAGMRKGRTHLDTTNVVMTRHMGGKDLDGILTIYIMLFLHLALSLSRWHCQAF